MISTFDPSSGLNGRWVFHNLTSLRDISWCKSCLYCGTEVSDEAVDMSFEIDKLLQLFHSQKRPAEPFSLPGGSPQKRRRILTKPDIPQVKNHAQYPAATPSITKPSLASTDQNIIELSSDPESIYATPPPRPKHTKKNLTRIKPKPKANSESEDEEIQVLQASSKHASWPLKYVKAMADGFSKMNTMSTGTLADHFSGAFESSHWQKVTWNTHSNIWNAASDELKEKYVEAGFSNAGLWKNFSKDVRAMYADGKIPGKRSIKVKDKPRKC